MAGNEVLATFLLGFIDLLPIFNRFVSHCLNQVPIVVLNCLERARAIAFLLH